MKVTEASEVETHYDVCLIAGCVEFSWSNDVFEWLATFLGVTRTPPLMNE